MSFGQGDKLKVKEPKSWAKTYGQGEPPKGLSVTVDGEYNFVKWGTIVKVSEGTQSKAFNMENAPMPLVNKKFADRIADAFETVEKATDN